MTVENTLTRTYTKCTRNNGCDAQLNKQVKGTNIHRNYAKCGKTHCGKELKDLKMYYAKTAKLQMCEAVGRLYKDVLASADPKLKEHHYIVLSLQTKNQRDLTKAKRDLATWTKTTIENKSPK